MAWGKHCLICGSIWFWMIGREGCLTKGCQNNIKSRKDPWTERYDGPSSR